MTKQTPTKLEEILKEFRDKFANQIDPAEYGANWEMKDLEAFIKKVYEAGGEAKMDEFAIQQLTGVHASEGRKVQEACMSMGLTRSEWNRIKKECNWLDEYEMTEIKDYLQNQHEK